MKEFNVLVKTYNHIVNTLHLPMFYLVRISSRTVCTGLLPRLCPNIGNLSQRSSFKAPAPLPYHHHLTTPPLLSPTLPPTCSPAVSPLAAPAPSRRASKPSPRGVSPRPQRSMRSLLSLSSALMEPTPARWYVIAGYPGSEGTRKGKGTQKTTARLTLPARTNSTPQPPSPPPSMPSPRPWRTSLPLSRRTLACRRS
jgi:hypothetical protein